ncbi:Activator of Hsp90 ATPase homolog 1-like protein [Klenkia soli]|uniref:Activator of Hsp90 ATPase homolog 1-like protein n=1 Tax=Klenkia soli TaxID=1052260 RepID=A0A1H0QCW1_9ACTN|nr:SRPBCC domain-containing protein [Klenkia soli]SDP15192.1 Activator of Hsp90 ATPase homolog 1-like protein [Klenkia soli]
MTDHGEDEVRGTVRAADGLGVVRLEVRCAVGVDELWSALTDRRRLGAWLGELDGDLRSGGEFTARFTASGWEGTARVEVCDPGRRLVVRTQSPDEPAGRFEVTLTPHGARTDLVVEDSGLPVDQLAAYGAGDQIHVEDLLAHLAARPPCDARARWAELHPGYQVMAPG